MSDEKQNIPVDPDRSIPLNFIFPEGQLVGFSNYATVQHDEFEFSISFFQIKKPILFPNDPDREEKLKAIKQVDATCISSVSMSLGRLPALIQALQNQLDSVSAEFRSSQSGHG